MFGCFVDCRLLEADYVHLSNLFAQECGLTLLAVRVGVRVCVCVCVCVYRCMCICIACVMCVFCLVVEM